MDQTAPHLPDPQPQPTVASPPAPQPTSSDMAPDIPSVRPVDLRDYVRFEGEGAQRVRVFATDVLTLDVWCLEPREATGVQLYPDSDVVYTVLGGTGWFVTDEGEIGLTPLGAILVPAGSAHGIDNRTADPLIVQAAASPPDGPLDALVEDAPSQLGAAILIPRESSRLAASIRRLLSGRRA